MTFLLAATAITIVVFILLLAPFFVGAGGRLAPTASINDSATLKEIKHNIVNRFVTEQNAYKDGQFSEAVWRRRREFLENKYIDVSRRLDFLNRIQEQHEAN